ncbi:Smr/MutS family protein [Aestuariivita sp.]|jgi:DNA-nicking Smr family endonuclease|uniref:Smr/MutS family protein n=1 Tax=Aestuariivita sp. TaxID=1872407 RepID=UPI00216C2D91|nr:Smr/MutS family protein [Aestuariivita sp.]MCE8005525.1 DNA mismatch repair protein MutS [Aestuariivita sp.]
MSKRRLRPDELALWQQVADRTERLHPERKTRSLPSPRPDDRKHDALREDFSIDAPFTVGVKAGKTATRHDLRPARGDSLSTAPVQMDRKSFAKMKRGKLKPEARIDLHGMTLDRAHPALTRFILTSQAAGRRLVLVITGKGKQSQEPGPIPRPRGVLRHQVPGWLSTPPLKQAVLQITPAHVSHGGEGAYYVYLRRQR